MSDMEQSDVVANDAPAAEPVAPAEAAPEAPVEAPAPEPVPVVAQAPSSAAASQQPEVTPESLGWSQPLSLEDAARALVFYVKAHRTAGDADVEAAIADVEAALPPAA